MTAAAGGRGCRWRLMEDEDGGGGSVFFRDDFFLEFFFFCICDDFFFFSHAFGLTRKRKSRLSQTFSSVRPAQLLGNLMHIDRLQKPILQ